MWLVLLLSHPGTASQVHPMPVTLPEVVARSPVVVLVEAAGPARPLRVPVQAPGGPWPDFQTVEEPLRVVAVLRAPPGPVQAGAVIAVAPADADEDYAIHRSWHVEGVAESPFRAEYAGSLAGAPRPERWLAFLRACAIGGHQGLCATAAGAVEAEAQREAVQALLPPTPTLPVDAPAPAPSRE
jgi:hypothetical protein